MDISPAALEVAKSNARAHGMLDRIEFLKSDLLSALPSDRMFDLVASNPPYIRESEGGGSGLVRFATTNRGKPWWPVRGAPR